MHRLHGLSDLVKARGEDPSGATPGRGLPFIAILSIFLIFLLTSADFWFAPNLFEMGDMAANGLQIERAHEGRELLGPYSRFHFHHPGPLAFYGLAVSEPLFGWLPTPLARHFAAQLAMNLMLILWCLHLLGRAGLSPALRMVGIFLLAAPPIFLGGGNMLQLAGIWGPMIVVFPLLLFVLALARFCAGDLASLPAAALGASISYQTHLMTLPVLATTLLGTTVYLLSRRGRWDFRPAWGRGQWYVWSALAVVLVTAVPILVEQAQGNPGNLTLLWDFVKSHQRITNSWLTIAHHLGQALTDPLVVLFPIRGVDWNTPLVTSVLFLLLGLVSFLQFRRSDRSWRLVMGAVWLSVISVVLAARHTFGELNIYFFYYLYALVGMLYLFAAKELWDRWLSARKPLRTRADLGVFLAGMIVMVPWHLAHPVLPPAPGDDFAMVLQRLALPEGRTVHLSIGPDEKDADLWTQIPTFALRFRREGVPVTVDERFVILCGQEMREKSGEPDPITLVFTRQVPPSGHPGFISLGSWGIALENSPH